MGAFPRSVYYLRIAWRSIPSLAGCALALSWAQWLAGWGEMPILVVLPIVMGFGMVVVYLLRPVRQKVFLFCYEVMLRSGNRILMDLGLWELLRVAYRFWPGSPFTDHVGFSTLHRIYDGADDRRREVMLEVLRHVEAYPNCPVAGEAHDFLSEIEATDIA